MPVKLARCKLTQLWRDVTSSVEILHWSAELLRWAGIDVPWRCIFKFVHKRKMLYHLHKCIAYHQSSWVTLYLVHSLRVDTFSSDGSYFMIYVLLVEWYFLYSSCLMFCFMIFFYCLFCFATFKWNETKMKYPKFSFKPVTIGVERPQITYLGVNGNKSHLIAPKENGSCKLINSYTYIS